MRRRPRGGSRWKRIWPAPALLFSLGVAERAVAQDSQYWTNQYGTKAQLLAGTVVGSVKDLSSTFYNPGAVSLGEDQTLVITADAIELTNVTTKDAAGTGLDLGSTRLATAPGMFALRLTPKSRNTHWALGYVTRQDVNLEVEAKRVEPYDPNDPFRFAGDVVFLERLNDTWGGVTWSSRVREGLGVGATVYAAFRSQGGRQQLFGSGVTQDSTGSSIGIISDYRYWNVRLLAKLGATYQGDRFTTGVAVTLPSLNLFGEGQTFLLSSATDLPTGVGSGRESFVTSDLQEGVATEFHSPFSLAIGCSYRWNRTRLHLTVESFAGVGLYDVMALQSFRSQTTGEVLQPKFNYSLQAVTNYGVGIEQEIRDDLELYAGFIRDGSGYVPNPETLLKTISSWDIHHLTLGGVFRVLNIDLTSGLGYSWGSDLQQQFVNLRPEQDGEIFPENQTREVTYRRLRLIVGFSVPL